MEYIDFLKYGAIGISLALALLSYRLLAKEQEKTTERPSMLTAIRNYFIMAIFLSVFFGITEIVSSNMSHKKSTGQEHVELNRLWATYFSEYSADSTYDLKAKRISGLVGLTQEGKGKTENSKTCEQLMAEAEEYKKKLADNEEGFFPNIVKLTKQLQKSSDGWTNLRYQSETKTETFGTLKKIFSSLGYDYDKLSNEELIVNWETLKKGWSSEDAHIVYHSDLREVVKLYLKKVEKQ